MSSLRAVLAALGLAITLSACRAPPSRVSERLTWAHGEDVGLTDLPDGSAELKVSAGEVVRIESSTPQKLGEVVRTAEGEAVVWQTIAPERGLVLVRPSLGTSGLRGARAVLRTAQVGVTEDPAYGWFALEDEALAWAETPLGTPFPSIAPAPRLPADLAVVDDVLRSTPALPPAVGTAIRSVAALRTIRALQGVLPYPYARNAPQELKGGGAIRKIEEVDFATIEEGRSVTLAFDGPTDVFVHARAQRGARDKVLGFFVEERGRRRAGTQTTVPKLGGVPGDVARGAEAGRPSALPPDVAVLARIHLSVPPGHHEYQLVPKGGVVYASAIESRPAVHLGDALSSRKNERAYLERAIAACSAQGAAPACVLVHALAGTDGTAEATKAQGSAGEKANALATRIASGESFDRPASLESSAVATPAPAVDALGRAVDETVDPALRGAWSRATSRATSWQPVSTAKERLWFAFLPVDELPLECKDAKPASTPTEQLLGAASLRVPSSQWRRARTVRLLVAAPCGPSEPVRIEVDGQVLTAQPSSDRVMWNVVVRGETSTIRRLDKGPGRVTVLAADPCATRGTFLRAPDPIAAPLPVTFPAGARSPGLEVWLRDGAGPRSIDVTAPNHGSVTVVAKAEPGGLAAIDEQAGRWLRAAHVPLPAWAAGGVTVQGPADVAIRPVIRAPRAPEVTASTVFAKPVDVAAVVTLSRRLIDAKDNLERGTAHLERALLLASFGLPTAADEDASAAKALGAHGPAGEDAIAYVTNAVLPEVPKPLEGLSAYGLEPDFDSGSARCAVAKDSARARVNLVDLEARQRPADAPLDPAFAARAVDAVLRAPSDPRDETLLLLAMPSSKWQLLRDERPGGEGAGRSRPSAPQPSAKVEGGGGRVPRPHDATRDPLIDADGKLRPRIVAGDPFGERFVSITSDHPARAFIADHGSVKGRIDYVCVPRRPSETTTRCPLAFRVGEGAPVEVPVSASGRGSVPLPAGRGRGKGAELAISVGEAEGDWLTLVRIVFEGKVLGTTEVAGIGWVLDTPHVQYRFLVGPAQPVHVRVKAATILRIDAIPDGGDPTTVVCNVDGREVAIPTDARPVVVATNGPADVTIESRNAKATLAIAERIAAPPRLSSAAILRARAAVAGMVGDVAAAHVTVAQGVARERSLASETPPGGLASALGTLGVSSGVVAKSIREGVRIDSAPDAFLLENLSYRRAIPSIGLYTMLGGSLHLREVDTSYGGHVGLFENLEAVHVRIGAFADVFAQKVQASTEATLRPRAFVEYIWRATPSLFVSPRLGYDGYYSTLERTPISARDVDDAVYNAFRAERTTLVQAQALVRYVPHFNDAIFVRPRVSFDAGHGALSHASLRAGGSLILGLTELDLAADAQYFVRTAAARDRSSVDATVDATVSQNLPFVPRTFNLQAGAQGGYRISDGAYQVLAVLSFTFSAGRGVTDFSINEHVFREQLPGGKPWSAGAEGLR